MTDHPPEGAPTIDRMLDGEWLIPDIVEQVHQALIDEWEKVGGDAVRFRAWITRERP